MVINKKIDSIEVVDSLNNEEAIELGEPVFSDEDTILNKNCSKKSNNNPSKNPPVSEPLGMIEIIETTGEIVLIENVDSLKTSPSNKNQKL